MDFFANVLILVFCLGFCSADEGKKVPTTVPPPQPLSLTVVSECLSSTSPYYVADKKQCDKFYRCQNGEKKPFLCPDGTAFDFPTQTCVFSKFVDCRLRPLLQNPKGNRNCPRLNGVFPDPNPEICDQYRICTGGKFVTVTCSAGLVFDPLDGVCTYGDLANRPECKGRGFVTTSHQLY